MLKRIGLKSSFFKYKSFSITPIQVHNENIPLKIYRYKNNNTTTTTSIASSPTDLKKNGYDVHTHNT